MQATPQVSRWKRFRYRLEYAALLLLKKGIPLLSRRACVALARCVGSLGYLFDSKGRKVALENLRLAFGSKYTEAERRRIARASYQYFVRTMIDLFWSPRTTRENYETYMPIRGTDVVDSMHGKRVVFLSSHRAGFEWSSIALSYYGRTAVVLGESHKNPLIGSVIDDLRGTAGHKLLRQEMSVLRLLRAVMRNEAVGFLIDLTVPPSQAATIIDAFGMKMCVSLLPATLHQRTGAALVPAMTEPMEDGSCEVTFHPPLQIPPGATGQQICQLCWNFLEEKIRARPETWLWAYKHWRFRPREAAAAEYPFYANISSKFEKLRMQLGGEGR